jgi:hypothetical protein
MSFKIRKLSFEIDLTTITDLPLTAKVKHFDERIIQIIIPHVEKLSMAELKPIVTDVEKLLHCNIYAINRSKSMEYVKLYADTKDILQFMKENEML